MKVSITKNILTYDNKSIKMDRNIIDFIIMSEYIIILEEFTGDDYNLVYCFDTDLNKLWKIKTPDVKFELPQIVRTAQKHPYGIKVKQKTDFAIQAESVLF